MALNSKLWIDNFRSNTFEEFEEYAAPYIGHSSISNYWDIFSKGFTILENAVSHEAIDKYLADLSRELQDPATNMLATSKGDRRPQPFRNLDPSIPRTKILDTHWLLSNSSLNVCLADPVFEFIFNIFQDRVVPFQSLHFEVGSTQEVHQDPAYVVISKHPNHFLASWIALEDIQAGSGELVYYPKSHKYDNFLYGINKDRKHWDSSVDGHEIHDHHLFWLHQQAQEKGLQLEKFNPKKGDVLIWHSDLAHGGGQIMNPQMTRRSLVTHYTRGSDIPYYLRNCTDDERQQKIVLIDENKAMSSMYYN